MRTMRNTWENPDNFVKDMPVLFARFGMNCGICSSYLPGPVYQEAGHEDAILPRVSGACMWKGLRAVMIWMGGEILEKHNFSINKIKENILEKFIIQLFYILKKINGTKEFFYTINIMVDKNYSHQCFKIYR